MSVEYAKTFMKVLVRRTKLKVDEHHEMEVLLGTSVSVHGIEICKNVQTTVQEVTFTIDFIVLELGAIYAILGMQWPRMLGKCKIDWEKHEYEFWYEGKRVKLTGDPSLHNPPKSLRSLQTNDGIHTDLQLVLERFEHVFKEPTELPPIRGREHGITLQPGLGPVSIQPYRYPQDIRM